MQKTNLKGILKSILTKALHPSLLTVLWLSVFSAAGLIYVFTNDLTESVFAYIVYPVSAYSLTVLTLKITDWSKKLKHHTLVQKTMSKPLVSRYITDTVFRGKIALYFSFFLNAAYVIFKLAMGVLYDSLWFVAIAFYYAVLTLMRFRLVRAVRNESGKISGRERLIYELCEYRKTGFLMLLLNAAMIGIVHQMVRNDMGYSYPGFIIYATAAYVFYTLIKAIINLFKFRGLNKPLMSASKFITLASALVSLLALQTAMLSRFGSDDINRAFFNALSGYSLLIGLVAIAVYMIVRGTYQIRKREKKH